MGEEKKPRWVERIKYSEDFASDEEAKRFLDEGLRMMRETEERFRRMFEGFDRWFEGFWRLPQPFREEAKEDLLGRVERMERDLAEIKELLMKKYVKKKEKPKYATA